MAERLRRGRASSEPTRSLYQALPLGQTALTAGHAPEPKDKSPRETEVRGLPRHGSVPPALGTEARGGGRPGSCLHIRVSRCRHRMREEFGMRLMQAEFQ